MFGGNCEEEGALPAFRPCPVMMMMHRCSVCAQLPLSLGTRAHAHTHTNTHTHTHTHRFLNFEEALLHCERAAITGLLEDLHRPGGGLL